MFENRSTEKEWMDELDSSGEVIIQTLKELDYINRKLGGNSISIHALKKLCKSYPSKSVTLADLGCGGGDILKEMVQWSRKRKIDLKLVGIDANKNIIEYANENCKDYPEISFAAYNIFSSEFQSLKFDIYHSSLFTHHFTDEELIELLSNCYKNCSMGIIINDLHRHWFAYFSIKWLTKFFSKSPMVQNDAAVSVQRGFSKSEVSNILKSAGITNFSIRWKWAFRWEIICFK
jgi:2-polyprenyl-3-methyl-5-hydroxy-6-metoxy-1,4-benzoquinol methylase